MQAIPVTPFNSLPINFKQLNPGDFQGFIFEEEKTIIEADGGYISDFLNQHIDLDKKDTTVINASVGQGKTTAIIKFIERYYKANKEGGDYIIIVATPFKSLIKQYHEKIKKASGLDDIYFDYQDLELGVSRKEFKNYHKKPIQFMTINYLLGNPGNIALEQSDKKREYYESLIEYAEENNKKIILIFDEIHEAIHNFKEELVFNLYKAHPVVHKIFVASATFTEASKVVIKYLAELTDKKIRILESNRVQVSEENLSNLHICFYNQYYYKPNSEVFEKLFIEEGKRYDKIHILSYSQKLAHEIYKSPLGKKLEETFGEFNLCISKYNTPFEPTLNNIGTIFKTGISIEEENNSYFIILPPKSSYLNEKAKSSLGIFTEGIYNIIQALARPRIKTDIYVIMPAPDKLIMLPETPPANYIKNTSLGFLNFDNPNLQSTFIDINHQDIYLKEFYSTHRGNLESGEEFVEYSNFENVPKFPSYDLYKLNKGERFFRLSYDIFGKNLSNYIYWAAWNNQFVNCKLKSIRKSSAIFFNEGFIQKGLDKYYKAVFGRSGYFTLNSDKISYEKFHSSLFSNNVFLHNPSDGEYKSISPYRNNNFEQQVIAFIQRIKKPLNMEFKKLVYPDGIVGFEYEIIGNIWIKKNPADFKIEKETYLRLAMSHSLALTELPENISFEEKTLINSYRTLARYKDILLAGYAVKSKRGELYLPIDKDIDFKPEHQVELETIIKNIQNFDKTLQAFSFLQKVKGITPIYKLLKDLFFEKSANTSIVTESGVAMKGNKTKTIELPNPADFINLIYDIDNAWLHQSGKTEFLNGDIVSQVVDEFSNNPFYGNFD